MSPRPKTLLSLLAALDVPGWFVEDPDGVMTLVATQTVLVEHLGITYGTWSQRLRSLRAAGVVISISEPLVVDVDRLQELVDALEPPAQPPRPPDASKPPKPVKPAQRLATAVGGHALAVLADPANRPALISWLLDEGIVEHMGTLKPPDAIRAEQVGLYRFRDEQAP